MILSAKKWRHILFFSPGQKESIAIGQEKKFSDFISWERYERFSRFWGVSMFVCSSLYTQFQRYSGPNANMKFFNENYQKYVNFSHFISSQQLGYFSGPNALMRGKNADSIFTAFLLFVNYGSYSFHLSKKNQITLLIKLLWIWKPHFIHSSFIWS